MKKSFEKYKPTFKLANSLCLVVVLACFVSVLMSPARVLAASASISLATETETAPQDTVFTVTVSLNADVRISAAQAYITFNPSQLSAQTITYSSQFTALPDSQKTADHILLSAYSLSGSNGRADLATITFKSLNSAGVASIDLTTSNSSLYEAGKSSGQNILTTVNGTAVSLQSGVSPSASSAIANSSNSPDSTTKDITHSDSSVLRVILIVGGGIMTAAIAAFLLTKFIISPIMNGEDAPEQLSDENLTNTAGPTETPSSVITPTKPANPGPLRKP